MISFSVASQPLYFTQQIICSPVSNLVSLWDNDFSCRELQSKLKRKL